MNADQVGAGIERMINAFSNLGFDRHEISGVDEVSSVPGHAVMQPCCRDEQDV